ncbi:MAG: hypothetical protein NT015_01545 [Alphaproteobacteria bacterium]|nr:hypothetical protein [Alphaproteobacteria bacterium]
MRPIYPVEAETAAFWLRMNAPLTTDTTQTTAPLALWRVAEAFMHILHALFGDPSQVAFRHTLTLKAHRVMASWLRCGEAMMRRLLLIEAATYAKPNIRPLLRAPHKRVPKLMHFFVEAPEKWRVSFRCFVSPTLRQAQADTVDGATSPESVRLSLSKAEGPRPFIFHDGRPPPRPLRGYVKRPNRKRHKPILRHDREWRRREEPLAFRSAWPLAERYEALLRVFKNPLRYAQRLSRQLHATPYRARELFHAPPDAHERIEHYAELSAAASASAAVFNSS